MKTKQIALYPSRNLQAKVTRVVTAALSVRLSPALFPVLCLTLCLAACKKESPPGPDKKTEASANSKPDSTKPGPAQQALAKFDADEDGSLSKDERDKMNQAYVEHFDSDGDNKLSDKEKEIARRRSRVTVVPSNPRTSSPEAAAAFLGRFDTDNDGKVSASEAGETRWKVMARSDTNKDGLISSQEWFAHNLRRQNQQKQNIPKAKK